MATEKSGESTEKKAPGEPEPELPGFQEELRSKGSCMERAGFILSLLVVHPVAFCFAMGSMISSVTTQSIVLDKVCYEQFRSDRFGSLSCEDNQNDIQRYASYWNIAISAAAILPSCPAILIWSAWANKTGDIRFIFMLSLGGLTMCAFILNIEAVLDASPMWLIPVVNLISAFSGLTAQVMNLIFTTVSLCVLNKKYLVVHFALANTMVYLGYTVGGFVGMALVERYSVASTQIVAMAFNFVGIVYTWAFLPSPGRILELIEIAKPIEEKKEKQAISESKPISELSVWKETKQLLSSAFHSYFRPRPGRARFHILLTLFAFTLSNASDLGFSATQNEFLYHEPLNFTTAAYGTYNGVISGVELVGNLIIVTFLKFFQCSDSLLLLISLLSNFGGLVILCFSNKVWMVYLSSTVAVIAFLNVSTAASFLVQLSTPEEQIVLIAGTGILSNVAALVSVFFYNYIYSATVDWFPGFVFGMGAVLTLISLVLQTIVHISWKMEQRSGKSASNKLVAIQKNAVTYDGEKVSVN